MSSADAVTASALEIDRRELADPAALPALVAERAEAPVLRWYVSHADDDRVVVELTTYSGVDEEAEREPVRPTPPTGQSAVVSIVPTGIGCRVGGFAGDAGPATKLLAACADYLVTNPNAVNGSDFACLPENLVYAEGSIVDAFCAARGPLVLPYANRVGLVLECAPSEQIDHALNVANAVRAVHGVDVLEPIVTEERLCAHSVRTRSGAFSGVLERPEMLLDACERLVAAGATAIAIASNPLDLDGGDYARHFDGHGPNPVGGVEAVISHLVCRRLGVPAAHAPLANFRDLELRRDVVDSRAAAEIVSASGLASVLMGLHRAPRLGLETTAPSRGMLTLSDVLAVVAPATALGGAPVLHARRHGIPVIAVAANDTILDVSAERLGLQRTIEVGSYAEAAGTIVALRAGVALESVGRPLDRLEADEDADRPLTRSRPDWVGATRT